MITQFNIRVYCLARHQDKILVLKEPFMGELIHKFPGGGLEFGEGTLECLHREFKEELNLEITHLQHFYTQEDFVETPFRPHLQLFLVYYTADIVDINSLEIIDKNIAEVRWIPITELNESEFELPVDKQVVKMLLNK